MRLYRLICSRVGNTTLEDDVYLIFEMGVNQNLVQLELYANNRKFKIDIHFPLILFIFGQCMYTDPALLRSNVDYYIMDGSNL